VGILRTLAQQPLIQRYPTLEYQEDRQINLVLDGDHWTESWKASILAGTKKHDVETGEDAKGG
jgi:hypothetical protein